MTSAEWDQGPVITAEEVIVQSSASAFSKIQLRMFGASPQLIFTDANDNDWKVSASASAIEPSLDFTPNELDGTSSSFSILINGGIIVGRSNTVAMPLSVASRGQSVLFDDTIGFLRMAQFSPVDKEVWHAPAFVNGWHNSGAGTYSLGGYRLMPDGMVLLKGLIVGGTVVDGTTMFTLPVGYRPKETHIFTCGSGNPPNTGTAIITGTNDLANAGKVSCFGTSAVNGMDLSCVRFAVASLT